MSIACNMAIPNPVSADLVKLLTINTNFLPEKLLPALAIGDKIPVFVRQNSAEGQGLISFRGVTIKAQLPTDIAQGERFLAEVLKKDDKILFHLTERLPSASSSTALYDKAVLAPNIQQELLNKQLANYLSRTTSPVSLPQSALNLKEVFQGAKALEEWVGKVLAFLPQDKGLEDSRNILAKLLDSAPGGNLAENLRRAAKTLREFITSNLSERNLSSSEQALMDTIKNNQQTSKQLRSFAQPGQNGSGSSPLDKTLSANILQLTDRLEHLASTQEFLDKLNPIMKELGEPAQLLFPYLFQGLLSQSQLTLDTPRKINDYERKKQGNSSRKSSNHIHLTVPLPTLGAVEIDITHSEKQIFVRLTTDEPGQAKFITSNLSELEQNLTKQGFKETHLAAQARAARSESTYPAWLSELHRGVSFKV